MSTKIKDIEPVLPYQEPYGYFGNFDGRMKRRLEAAPVEKNVWWLQPRWSLSFSAVIIVVMAWFGTRDFGQEVSIAAIPAEQRSEYLLTHTDAYMAVLVSEEDIELEMPAAWMSREEAEAYLETENLENLMTEL